LQRRRVVHAVAMLRHVGIDLQRLGFGLSGLRADGDVDGEVLRYLNRLCLVGKNVSLGLELRPLRGKAARPSREAQYGCSKEPKTCSPFFHAMRSATSRGRSASQRRDQSAWPWT